jgi:hypothetical protein
MTGPCDRTGSGYRIVAVVLALASPWLAACTTEDASSAEHPNAVTTSTPSTTTKAAVPDTVTPRWATLLTGPSSEDEIDGVAAAPDGAVYLTGKFERSTTVGGQRLVSAGKADIPLARFDRDGSPTWVRRFGGPGEDNFFDVDADGAGAVAAGIFEGTVAFDDITLTSAGSWDCVVVAFDPEGSVDWAGSFGGPGPDGCNEVALGRDGTVVTSLDTPGGWTSPAGKLPTNEGRDTLLLSIDRDGTTNWGRLVGGPGSQRGKAIAVGPDGSIAFGGDTRDRVVIDDEVTEVPGRGADAWISRWSADGEHRWTRTWGGASDDIAKGLAFDEDGIYAVGTFGSAIDLAGVPLDAGPSTDLAVARFDRDGELDWATSVRADEPLAGAELVTAADGGIVFAGRGAAGLAFASPSGEVVALDDRPGGTAFLVHFRPDGSVGLASTIAGTADAGADEIARVGDRVYLDLVIRGSDNIINGNHLTADGKDGSLWALDL